MKPQPGMLNYRLRSELAEVFPGKAIGQHSPVVNRIHGYAQTPRNGRAPGGQIHGARASSALFVENLLSV